MFFDRINRVNIIDNFLSKAKELPIGAVSMHGGVKMKKVGKGKWTPVSEQQGSVDENSSRMDKVKAIISREGSKADKVRDLHDLGMKTGPIASALNMHYSQAHSVVKKHQNKWLEKFKQYKLSAYPINIGKAHVTVDLSGDVDTKAVMKWKDPKTGKEKRAYTQVFMERSAANKWDRITKVTSADIQTVKNNADSAMQNSSLSQRQRDAAAIVSIIAHTGLRPGSMKGFKETKNRGVSTLSKQNITIDGDTVSFDFKGKSYKQNTATIKSKVLAQYLTDTMEGKKDNDFIFKADTKDVNDFFKSKEGGDMRGFKVKDMRTWIATDMARNILFTDTSDPPPLSGDKKKDDKAIQKKLKGVYEKVSQRLNNTPAMAKNSYIAPVVVQAWLDRINEMYSSISKAQQDQPLKLEMSMDEIVEKYKNYYDGKTYKLNEEDEEFIDVYPSLTQL